MPDTPNPIIRFWQELKRRRVVRMITVYAAAAFVILELVSIIAEPLKLPEWTLIFMIVFLVAGFIIAVILSWIYDVGPGGIEKTTSVKEARDEIRESPSRLKAWKIATYTSGIVIIVLVLIQIFSHSDRGKEFRDQEKTIAVLPFENMSDDSEFDHLGDAMTDEIIMQLYKIHEFEVRSRTSCMQFKDTEKGSPQIGEELNVNYLLEGSAQRYEDKVRIRIQLIHAPSDNHIWGEVYDGKWEDIFDIQINVAKQVAGELHTVLSSEEVERIEVKPTENIEAYNLYLLGRFFWTQRGKENLDQSIEFLQTALEIDPDYALAYSGMAATYTRFATSGLLPRSEVMDKAKAAAKKALEIDNTLGEAHAELAWATVYQDFDWIEGEKGFQRSLELNPNYADAHHNYAWLLTMMGRFEEAIEENKRALELDPLSYGIRSSYARKFIYTRDYDRAIEELRSVIDIYRDSKFMRSELALAYSLNGMHEEALEECVKIDYPDRDLPILNWTIGYIMGAAGETDRALDWLEKAYEQREGWLVTLKVEPMYDPLRSEPRFQAILEKMNFPE